MSKVLMVLVVASVLSVPALAGPEELATINLGEKASYWGPVFFHYVPSLTKIINQPIPNEADIKEVRVASLRLSPTSADTLLVDYTEGPSADPGFIISLVGKCGPQPLGWAINGLDLEAPGDGYFYVRGHTDSWFDMRRKFTVEAGNLHEVKQPFYYVGLETRTLKQVHLYSTQGCYEMIGWIEKGAPVTVVLSDGCTFLLKTEHDILGWWRPQNMSQQSAEEIEGIYYKGD